MDENLRNKRREDSSRDHWMKGMFKQILIILRKKIINKITYIPT